MAWRTSLIAALALAGPTATGLRTSFTVNELRAMAAEAAEFESQYSRISSLARRQDDGVDAVPDTDPSLLYPPYNLTVPVDHLHNDTLYEPHTNDTFNLRYWFDASHYQEGGPVIVFQGGEASAASRLPLIQKGILAILAQATGGISVVMEHRYYGTSFPPVPDLSAGSLRFLTTDQTLADMAYFAKNVKFAGLEDKKLNSPDTAWIAWGGSYGGAVVALLRKLYPDVYWGAVSSSGVTEAIYDYWEYWEAARIFAPGNCGVNTQKLTNVVDNILIGKDGTEDVQKLKDTFGLGQVTRSDDFANALSGGIGGLQGQNWDPALNSTTFGEYCDAISSATIVYNATEDKKDQATEILQAGGYADEVETLLTPLLNYIGWVNESTVASCTKSGQSQDACFTNYNTTFYELDNLRQTWRAWPYQYCTEWGYLQTGSGVPEGQLPVISRLINLEFSSEICKRAFNITTPSKVERINQWGGFNFSYPRLAITDGQRDPWRQATPHAMGLPDRVSTDSEPFLLIEDGVHHWDENGLFPNQTTATLPPAPVKDAQAQQVVTVKLWMEEWKKAKSHTKQNVPDEGPLEL